MNEIGKKYQTPLSEFKPELQPNGRIVKCIEDKGNGFLVVKCDDETEPNTWLVKETDLTEEERSEQLKPLDADMQKSLNELTESKVGNKPTKKRF